jgi:DNA repair photolyase
VKQLENEIKAKSLLNRHKKRDEWFLGDYTINPYAGCSMGCIYCYTRGSKYGGNYGVKVVPKSNAVPILKKQLKNSIRRNERGFIVLGSASDPYPTVEKDMKLTREILGLIKRYKFPLHILTKSTRVARDMDILNAINEVAILPPELDDKLDGGVIVSFSLSTLNDGLARIIEPGAPSPINRLETMKMFSEAGFKTGVINMPVLPYISDSKDEIEDMVKMAINYGGDYVLYSGLTLYGDASGDCKTLYDQFLKENYPELLSDYKKLFRGSFAPSKDYQDVLAKKFAEISRKYGIKNSII